MADRTHGETGSDPPIRDGAEYAVVRRHVGTFPEPIELRRGDRVSVGPEYDGPEGWRGWRLCAAAGQKDGWVPEQMIELDGTGGGIMKEDYCARELTTSVGERVIGSRIVNGWLWASRPSDGATGWVPISTVRALGPGTGDASGGPPCEGKPRPA